MPASSKKTKYLTRICFANGYRKMHLISYKMELSNDHSKDFYSLVSFFFLKTVTKGTGIFYTGIFYRDVMSGNH